MRTDGQTDRHDEPNSRFSQFYEHTLNTIISLNSIHILVSYEQL
jgi:hypothetical protein